jgi:hypothetical protein
MFLIIWRGWGILVPVVAFVVGFMPLAIAEAVLGHNRYSEITKPLTFLSLLAAAGTIWVVGRALNSVPGRILIDPATNRQVILRRRHDLFFIPMQWWAVVLILGAVVGLFAHS